jgi:TRAP-type transport system periplasmic protein
MTTFKRRTMLAAAAALAATNALWTSGDVLAQTSLTLGHGAAPGNPRSVAAERFAELVAEKTGGEVTITVAGSEQLGNDVAMLTSLRSGTLDFTINSQGAVSGVVPELAALGLPFLFETADEAVEILRGPIGDELDEKFAAIGIVPLDWWDNGIRHISTRDRAVAR